MLLMQKGSYRTIAWFLAIFVIWVSIPLSQAHSPASVSLAYNLETQELTVSISHSVSSRTSHYIENIIVELNGEEVINEDYTDQPSMADFSYGFALNASVGDEIIVTANCNQGGSGSGTLTVVDESTDDTTDDDTDDITDDTPTKTTIPGYPLIWVSFMVVGLIGYMRYRHQH